MKIFYLGEFRVRINILSICSLSCHKFAAVCWKTFCLVLFYARQQNASRVLAIVWASVCPSVCHTRELYQNGAS